MHVTSSLSLTLACLWRISLLLFWIRSFLLAAHVRHVLSLTHSVKAKLLVHLSRSSKKYLCAHGQGDIERSIDHPKLPNVTRRWDLLVCCPSRKVIGLQPQTAKWPTASYRSGWWNPTNQVVCECMQRACTVRAMTNWSNMEAFHPLQLEKRRVLFLAALHAVTLTWACLCRSRRPVMFIDCCLLQENGAGTVLVHLVLYCGIARPEKVLKTR
jgi:hypothetical protein